MDLYIVRHGETDWNKERRLQGTSDISLNSFGEELARKTNEGLRDIKFDLNISSPLTRTLQTADLILEGREVPRITDDRIIEMGFGSWEGKHIAPELGELPETFRYFHSAPERYEAPDDGESFEQVKERTGEFLKDLYHNPEYQDKSILITTHGAALAGLLCNIKNLPISEFWNVGVHKNCAVTYVQVTNGIPEIKFANRVYYDDYVEDWFAAMLK